MLIGVFYNLVDGEDIMAVTVELTDEQFARVSFEKLLEHNNKSTDKNSDGTYYYNGTQSLWVVYQAGFRRGRESAGATCEF
jgi:hypothetical protein